MTIAELLVQTEATLFAANDFRAMVETQCRFIAEVRVPSLEELKATQASGRESAAKEARRIVAAIYGEPCDGTKQGRVPIGSIEPEAQLRVTAWTKGRLGDECFECRWPRSAHAEAKP